MLFTRQQQVSNTDNPFRSKIVEQVQKMELQPKDKTRLADFALTRANYLAQFAWQSWNCNVVAVRVCAHEIRYGVNVPNGLVKKALGMSAQVSHAMKATASVEQMEDGKIVIVVQVPFASAVPTFAELGLSGFEDLPYYGIWAPHGTPKAVVDRYSDAVAKVIALPEVKERLSAMGLAVGHMTPQQLDAREKAYTATWARIIKASGFQAQ